jgi:hypothetical protein
MLFSLPACKWLEQKKETKNPKVDDLFRMYLSSGNPAARHVMCLASRSSPSGDFESKTAFDTEHIVPLCLMIETGALGGFPVLRFPDAQTATF